MRYHKYFLLSVPPVAPFRVPGPDVQEALRHSYRSRTQADGAQGSWLAHLHADPVAAHSHSRPARDFVRPQGS